MAGRNPRHRRRRARRRAHRHRADEPELPSHVGRGRVRRAQAGRAGSGQPRHRRGPGRLSARDPLLPRGGPAHRGAAGGLPRRALRGGRGLVHTRARGRRARAPGRPDRGVLGGGGAAGDARAGPDPRPRAGGPRAGGLGLAQPALAAEPGPAGAAAARLSRALRRPRGARAPRAVRADDREPRRLERRPPSAIGPRPRRLPHRQHAVRRGGRPAAAHGGRLADRLLRPGDDGRLVLPRRRAHRRGPARARGGAAARVPLGVEGARRSTVRVGRVLGGLPPPGVPRRGDGGGGVDAGGTDGPRRRHVHDQPRAPRPAGDRPRLGRAAARPGDRSPAGAAAQPGGRGSPPRGA